MAMFRGSGLDAADRLIKADTLGRDGYRLLDTIGAPAAPDLHTLSCRWAPLAAELLACQLEGEPLPLERQLAEALDPARFLLRERRRAA